MAQNEQRPPRTPRPAQGGEQQPTSTSAPTGFKAAIGRDGGRREDRPRREGRGGHRREDREFEEKLIGINRVAKTTKGGRMLRFSALVVVGDRKGRVGFGTGKSSEVPDAIKKAIKNAQKQVQRVKITSKGTVFHEVVGRHGASQVLLKPAPDGTGIVAGGAIRAVIELAGYSNVYSKNLGARSPLNMVRATVDGLQQMRTPHEVAKLRDRDVKEL